MVITLGMTIIMCGRFPPAGYTAADLNGHTGTPTVTEGTVT